MKITKAMHTTNESIAVSPTIQTKNMLNQAGVKLDLK